MKIFHLPPKYIDNATLLSEKSILEYLFFKITDEEYSPSQQNRLLSKFYNYHQFIFIRLRMIVDELERREFSIDMDDESYLKEITNFLEYDISSEEVASDIEFLYSIWKEYLDYDSNIPSLIEQLTLTNPDDLLEELNSLISEIKERYELA